MATNKYQRDILKELAKGAVIRVEYINHPPECRRPFWHRWASPVLFLVPRKRRRGIAPPLAHGGALGQSVHSVHGASMTDLDTHDDLKALTDLGFLRPKFFSPDHWAALISLGSFVAIVDGGASALRIGYQNRWLYRSFTDAGSALHEWTDGPEPRDWISAHLSQDMTVWP